MEAPLSHVLDLLQAQQAQLAVLASRLALLGNEHEALCECLAASGAVPAQRLLAWLHRRRFAAMRRWHPCASRESLESLLQAKELALTVAACAGPASAACLGACSRALREDVAGVARELLQLFPPALYAVGGEAGGAALASVERFDVLSNSWAPSAPLLTPRSGCAAVALEGALYVMGGCSAGGEDLSSVERFDLRQHAWEALPPMHSGRDELAAAAAGGRVYAVGGSCLIWPVRHVTGTVERLEASPLSGTWEALPPLGRERCAAAAVAVAGQVCVLGGCDEDGTALDSAERYDEEAGAWEPLPPMGRPRCNFAAAVASGCVFVAGGYDERMRDLDAVERLDPSSPSWTWELVSSLHVPRWGVRAVGWGGAVFVVGGHDRDGEAASVDRLDPETGAWVELAPLREARRSFGLAACRG